MSFDFPFGRLFGFGNFVITLICPLVLLLLAIVLSILLLAIVLSVLFLLAIVLSVLLLLAIVLSVLLLLAIVLSVIFLLAIVLSVLLRLTASDYLWMSSNFSCTRLASRITFTVYIQGIGKPNKFIV